MLHRSLLSDDGKGVGEYLSDHSVVRTNHWVVIGGGIG